MSTQDESKRRKRQNQIQALIVNFDKKYSAPKPANWAKLCENMRRKARKMTPALLEEVIAFKRPDLLQRLIGKADMPDGELLPIDYFLGETIVDNGERIRIEGIRIEDIEGGKTTINSTFRDEDLEPLAYAIAYVLAGRKVADMIPTYRNPKISENNQLQMNTNAPAKK